MCVCLREDEDKAKREKCWGKSRGTSTHTHTHTHTLQQQQQIAFGTSLRRIYLKNIAYSGIAADARCCCCCCSGRLLYKQQQQLSPLFPSFILSPSLSLSFGPALCDSFSA